MVKAHYFFVKPKDENEAQQVPADDIGGDDLSPDNTEE
jgi:hypothetical protein